MLKCPKCEFNNPQPFTKPLTHCGLCRHSFRSVKSDQATNLQGRTKVPHVRVSGFPLKTKIANPQGKGHLYV